MNRVRPNARLALACACGLLCVGGGTAIESAAAAKPVTHTVTAKGAFDSHDIAAGKSWKFTPRKAGGYAYICTLHPNMRGTLKVE